jgi:serine phosphatase RsbU (regulator of sigma subunit)/pSer/pThr/pTyr-binding forkhead associated (FHA) protein
MPSLHVLKGPNEGAIIPLDGDRFVLGRNPDCGIVIPVTSVSREHALIVRVQGKFFIEDKQSRNGTFVNNQAISQRTALRNNDRIRICDFIAAFLDNQGSVEQPAEEPEDGLSTVEAMLTHTANQQQLFDTAPAEKLRTMLEITANLSKTLELNTLLPKIADSLFHLFRQADRCFLIETDGERLMPRVVKTRRASDEANARFSKSIVKRALESAQAFLSDDASRDDRIQLSQSVVDFRIRSVMCAPLCRADGKAFGVIQLDTQDRSKKFTQDDLKLLCGVANQASIALENARLLNEAVYQERLKRDLLLATQVQNSFLPRALPKVNGFEFHAVYEPAQQVGGDYYGYIPLPGGKLAVLVGDVAGKGVPAALLMAKLSSEARYCYLSESDPAKALAHLNDLLTQTLSEMDRFVTLCVLILDPASATVTMVSAGHGSPYRYRPGQPLEEVMPKSVPGMPLGIMEGAEFESSTTRLEPGDSLLLFTDGVNESKDVNGKDFDLEGVQRSLKEAGRAGARDLVERLVKAVKAHAAGRDPHDDVTVVAVGRSR